MVTSRGAASVARCIRAGAWRARYEQEEKGPSFVGEVLMARRKTRRRQCRSEDWHCRRGRWGYGPVRRPRVRLPILITANDYPAYCEIRASCSQKSDD